MSLTPALFMSVHDLILPDQPTCPGIAEGDDGTAVYGPVCCVVWEGRLAMSVPIPIAALTGKFPRYNTKSKSHNQSNNDTRDASYYCTK